MAQPSLASATPGGARLAGLDTLRACAILWVMIYHAQGFNLVADGMFVEHGWMGVDLFFVLSGFLIGGQLFRTLAKGAPIDLRTFYLRRLFRTAPAYVAVLAIYALAPGWWEWPHMQPLWQYVTFTENLLIQPPLPKAFSHVWSLCVEEQFYLVFPLLVLLLAWRPSAWKVWLAGGVVLFGGMALRAGVWLHNLAPLYNHGQVRPGYGLAYQLAIYYPTWTRLDGLLVGVAAAAVEAFRPAIWSRLTHRANLFLALGLAGLAASVAVFKYQSPGFYPAVFGYPLLSASVGLLLVAAAAPRGLLSLKIPGAKTIALMSYSLYLSHKLVLGWAMRTFHTSEGHIGWLPGLTAGVLVLICGVALYLLIERPGLRLRNRVRWASPKTPA